MTHLESRNRRFFTALCLSLLCCSPAFAELGQSDWEGGSADTLTPPPSPNWQSAAPGSFLSKPKGGAAKAAAKAPAKPMSVRPAEQSASMPALKAIDPNFAAQPQMQQGMGQSDWQQPAQSAGMGQSGMGQSDWQQPDGSSSGTSGLGQSDWQTPGGSTGQSGWQQPATGLGQSGWQQPVGSGGGVGLGQSQWQQPATSGGGGLGQSEWQRPAGTTVGQSGWQQPAGQSAGGMGQSQWQQPAADSGLGQSQWQTPASSPQQAPLLGEVLQQESGAGTAAMGAAAPMGGGMDASGMGMGTASTGMATGAAPAANPAAALGSLFGGSGGAGGAQALQTIAPAVVNFLMNVMPQNNQGMGMGGGFGAPRRPMMMGGNPGFNTGANVGNRLMRQTTNQAAGRLNSGLSRMMSGVGR